MLYKFKTKFLIIILPILSLFFTGADLCYHVSTVNGTKIEKNIDLVKEQAICDLAKRLGIPVNEIQTILHVSDRCWLIPLIALEEHKLCLIDIFSKSDKNYMKYYLNGKLISPRQVEERFYNRGLYNLWEKPNASSITFIIDYDNKSVGRIGVGPIRNRGGVDCEIGYAIKQEYSGKGLTISSVRAVLNLLHYMTEKNSKIYNFKRLRATVSGNNRSSVHILEKLNFKRNGRCGKKIEYFYFF